MRGQTHDAHRETHPETYPETHPERLPVSTAKPGLLSVDELRADIAAGAVDTVLVAFTDMQGRLAGKRLHAAHFLEDVLGHGTEGCNCLLAVDVEMNTVEGYEMSSWDRGYGDFMFVPDLTTLRRVPWQEATALLLADLAWEDGSDVLASPRQILKRQTARLRDVGLKALVGTELEFIVFRDTFESAWHKAYRGLEPANLYNGDYSMLGTSRVEPLLRRMRNGMVGAGMSVESAKGECNLGQHEIAFKYDDAVVTCDNHSIYKTGAKEIAAQEGMSLTFMAKFNEREGNSCHIHISLRGLNDDAMVLADGAGLSAMGEHFLAGQQACLRELSLLLAPNINSYKRFVPGSFAPDDGEVGPGQPHLRAPAGRPRPVVAGGEPGARRRRQPLSRGRGTRRGRPARHRGGAPPRRSVPGQRLRRRRRARAGHAARRARAVGGQRPGP